MINFTQFPRHDHLNHMGAIHANIKRIKNNIKKRKDVADASYIENLLNNIMYSQKTGQPELYEEYRKQIEIAVNNFLSSIYGEGSKIILDQRAEGAVGNVTGKFSKNAIGKMGKTAEKIKTILIGVEKAKKINGMSEAESEKLKAESKQLLQDLATLETSKAGRISEEVSGKDFVKRYNNLVNTLYSQNYYEKLGAAGEAFNAAVFALATGSKVEDLDKMIEKMIVGGERSSATISGKGLTEEYLQAKNILLKGWHWEDGMLKCNTKSQDKIDVIFGYDTPNETYISVKNYQHGATGDLHLSGETHLASLLASAAVAEPFSRAYMRFLGWKPGHWRDKEFYNAQEVINMAKNTILILAISGLGFQDKHVDILTINNRAKGYWKCYSLKDLADKLLRVDTAKGASISGIPSKVSNQGVYHEHFFAKFLHLKVGVQVRNLEALMR